MFLWAAVEARLFKSLLIDFKPALRLRSQTTLAVLGHRIPL